MSFRLQLIDVHIHYGSHAVLRGVNLQLHAGELTGLVGPNGSGKSTLLRALAGTQARSRGQVRIDGHDLDTDLLAARRALGFAVEPERLPRLLTGRQCLELLADLRSKAAATEESDSNQNAMLTDAWRFADALQLTAWLDRPIHTYSLGTRQKLAIVQALLGSPKLIVLDEVLNGLDPLAAYALKVELRARADDGAAILLATHGLEVAERFLDRAVLLLDGQIAADWDRVALAAFRADPDGGLEHAVAQRLRLALDRDWCR